MLIRRGGAALALVVLAACGGGDSGLSPPVSATTAGPGRVTRVVRATVDMTVGGAETLSVRTETQLRIVEFFGDQVPKQVHFLSVSVAAPLEASDGRQLLFTADLSPGLYDGPGEYTLTEEAAQTVGGTEGLPSAAYVQLIDQSTQPPGVRRFDKLVEPCAVAVGEGQATGEVTCPALGNEEDETVSLRWSWELL